MHAVKNEACERFQGFLRTFRPKKLCWKFKKNLFSRSHSYFCCFTSQHSQYGCYHDLSAHRHIGLQDAHSNSNESWWCSTQHHQILTYVCLCFSILIKVIIFPSKMQKKHLTQTTASLQYTIAIFGIFFGLKLKNTTRAGNKWMRIS